MERSDIPDKLNVMIQGYCGHPTFPYAHIRLEQATKLIISHFQEDNHPFIHDTLKNKTTQLVSLYILIDLRNTHPERI